MLITDIEWNIASSGSPLYPSALPAASSISTAVGNNNPEALSAYLNALENDSSTGDPGSVIANLEWLLNALQFGRLPYLGAGEMGVGQLDEYLHARSFGSGAGGYRWSVRHLMTPGSKATPKEPVNVTLPLPLAKLLSQLNDRQQQYDATADEILSRQQKLFFDWGYHIDAIATNVIGGTSQIGSDTSGAYLLDGLMHLLPRVLAAGASGRIDVHGGPSPYSPATFHIAAPGDQYSSLAQYPFNAAANRNAAPIVNQLLDLFYALDGAIPVGLDALAAGIGRARDLVAQSLGGGTTARSYLTQAIAAVRSAQTRATALAAAFAKTTDTTTGLAAIKAAIDADESSLAALLDPSTGVFATYLPVVSADTVPTPPGQVYTGRIASFAAFRDAASWGASGAFNGIGDLVDQLTGRGAYQPHVFDTQLAGLDVATAFFWRQSGDTAAHTTAYYLQLATREIANAQSDALLASAAVQQAIAALTGAATVAAIGHSLDAIATTVLPDVIAALTSNPPDAMSALVQLEELAGGVPRSPLLPPGQSPPVWPLPALVAGVSSPDWMTVTAAVETAWLTILARLPLAHQVSLLSTFLDASIHGRYQLGTTPAAAYWQPTEPVLLLAQPSGAGDLIKPVNRNGVAALLPCRPDSEILTPIGSVTWPAVVSRIASNVNPSIAGLAAVLQELVEEGWLLNVQTPAADLRGVPPYSIAWNRWSGQDDFLPLFVFWQAEYVYSQRIDFATEGVPSNYLDDYALDRHLVGYQPQSATLTNFQKNLTSPNYFSLYGVVSLSSAATLNLLDQIRTYCTTTFDYDPSTGPPETTAPNCADMKLFYDAFRDFQSRSVLSQGLSGFNAGLRQRAQDLQLPLNVPPLWVSQSGSLPPSAFWATQFLLNQSAGWPDSWSSEAIDFNAFAAGNAAIYFNPLRAGYLQVETVTLVDVFGRFVDVPSPNPQAIAETLQSQPSSPLADHPVYLPPRLVQASRLVGQWISAASPDGLREFTQWNPHPAASPICGWLLPNHLDGSLMLYNADGARLGSLGPAGQLLRWFTVPGEPYTAGIDNRTLMLDDLATRQANAVMQSVLQAFAYADETSTTAANFQKFLGVIDQAQQFIVTKSMQEDQALAVLIGQPLVLARVSVRLQLQGLADVSLDASTYPPWNLPGTQFQMNTSGYIPYDFGNFNTGGITALQVPLRVGAVDYQKNGQVTPYFDDGLVGFFVNDDYRHVLYAGERRERVSDCLHFAGAGQCGDCDAKRKGHHADAAARPARAGASHERDPARHRDPDTGRSVRGSARAVARDVSCRADPAERRQLHAAGAGGNRLRVELVAGRARRGSAGQDGAGHHRRVLPHRASDHRRRLAQAEEERAMTANDSLTISLGNPGAGQRPECQ